MDPAAMWFLVMIAINSIGGQSQGFIGPLSEERCQAAERELVGVAQCRRATSYQLCPGPQQFNGYGQPAFTACPVFY